MGSELSIFNNQTNAPASARGLSPLAQSLASSSGSTTRRIQTNTNGTFKRIVNGDQIGDAVRSEINLIIVAAQPKVSRTYYAEKYDPNAEKTLPNCWSNLGEKPESAVPDAQGKSCSECPQNIAGSGDNGGRACRFQRRISVLVEGDTTGEVYQFNVPAKSLFGKGVGNVHPFESYIKFLVNNGESPDNVVTSVKYNDNADSMELQFSPLRNISDEEFELVVDAQGRPETEMYTKLTVAQADKVTAKPAQAAIAKPEPEPQAETVVVDEPIDEPIKRKATNKASQGPAPKALEDVINDWA